MKNKIIYIFIICGLVLASGAFYVYKSLPVKQTVVTQKCPEDYAENDIGTAEYKDALVEWTTDFFEAHPEATMSDWSRAKTQFWMDYNCTVALQRLKLSGRVEDLKPYELVDYEIQNALIGAMETPLYNSEYGFAFNYPDSMRVMADPENTDHNFHIFIIPNSDEANEDEPMNAVVISGARNRPPLTPLEWLEGPNSGADMSKGYNMLNIGGQEAVSMEGGTWIVINTPDNEYRLSIATLPSENPGQLLRDQMSEIIDSLAFR